MNAQTKVGSGSPLNVHRKLSLARQKFHALELKKSGRNTFANYSYFELGDFLLPALAIFDEVGLGTTPVTFDGEFARMDIVDLDKPEDRISLCSPMGSAALKGCHEVQNIGAVETYQRRYLWVNALEIVEHDALDATTGNAAAKGQSQQGAVSPPAVVSDAQWGILTDLIEKTGTDARKFCEAYRIESVKALTAEAYPKAKAQLEKKLAGMKQKEPA